MSTIIYENQEAKVKDTLIIYAAEVGWFEPVVNELGEGHEKDDTKNFGKHMIKFEIYNRLVCTSSHLLSNFIEKLLQGAIYFLPILPCLSRNPLETLLETGELILHPYHVDFIAKREALFLQWAFVIGVFTGAWPLGRVFSWMRTDALLNGFTINRNVAKNMWNHLDTPRRCSCTDCVEYVALTKSYTWLSTPL